MEIPTNIPTAAGGSSGAYFVGHRCLLLSDSSGIEHRFRFEAQVAPDECHDGEAKNIPVDGWEVKHESV
jgi:hypothetical protein